MKRLIHNRLGLLEEYKVGLTYENNKVTQNIYRTKEKNHMVSMKRKLVKFSSYSW